MSKSTKPRNDWDAIRADYVSGMHYYDMSKKYDICHTQILRKAKKEGWIAPKMLVQSYDELANLLKTEVDEVIKTNPKAQQLQQRIHETLLPSQIEQADKDIAMMSLYKANIASLQAKFAKVIEKSVSQVSEILDHHKDGLYTSSLKGDGSANYERTTRFLSDLAPFFAENNKALGLTSAQVAIQNNVNTNNDDVIDDQKVIINISGKK
jgi:hypothetical protein